jgi:uncharacterized protein YqjF (DUF2071 family)
VDSPPAAVLSSRRPMLRWEDPVLSEVSSAGDSASTDGRSPAALPGVCPYRINAPVMGQRWHRLTFLHWQFEPAVVQRLLPRGLTVEPRDGAAWVGLVPFMMQVTMPGVGIVPWASRFCETNVRTYVTDGAGRSGIWFFSLDAARLGAVVVARTTYRLPYFWSAMSLDLQPPIIRYHCRRRWPGPRGAPSHAVIEIGAAYQAGEATPLEHFLTARWALFSVSGPRSTLARHRFAVAEHTPWPLYRARVIDLDDHLVAAAGLPQPEGPPLAHYSPGVDVRIGRPQSDLA